MAVIFHVTGSHISVTYQPVPLTLPHSLNKREIVDAPDDIVDSNTIT